MVITGKVMVRAMMMDKTVRGRLVMRIQNRMLVLRRVKTKRHSGDLNRLVPSQCCC